MDPVKTLRKIRQKLKRVCFRFTHKLSRSCISILSVFFHHLDANTAPTEPPLAKGRSPTPDQAFMSLLELTKAANVSQAQNHVNYGDEIVKAWPGVSRVSLRRTRPKYSHGLRMSCFGVITATWYSLSRSVKARKVMSATKGSIEIATYMWILEDKHNVPSIIDISSPSATLDTLLRDQQRPALDRVVTAARETRTTWSN